MSPATLKQEITIRGHSGFVRAELHSFLIAVCIASTPSISLAIDIPVGVDQYTVSFDPGSITHPDLTWPDTSSGRCTFGGLFRASRNPADPQNPDPASRSGTFRVRFTPAPGRRFTSGYLSYGGGLYTRPFTIVQGSTALRIIPLAGGAGLTGAFDPISFCQDNASVVWLPGFTVVGTPCGAPARTLFGPITLPPNGFEYELDMSIAVFGEGFINFNAVGFELFTEPLPPCACAADFNCDGFLDFFDYDQFVECYETEVCGGGTADFNADGFVDFFDYDDFVAAFESGC
jgi:hypothetical protein